MKIRICLRCRAESKILCVKDSCPLCHNNGYCHDWGRDMSPYYILLIGILITVGMFVTGFTYDMILDVDNGVFWNIGKYLALGGIINLVLFGIISLTKGDY